MSPIAFLLLIGSFAPGYLNAYRTVGGTLVSAAADMAQPEVLHGEIMDDGPRQNGGARSMPPRIDIGAVIAKALEAAGLMKR